MEVSKPLLRGDDCDWAAKREIVNVWHSKTKTWCEHSKRYRRILRVSEKFRQNECTPPPVNVADVAVSNPLLRDDNCDWAAKSQIVKWLVFQETRNGTKIQNMNKNCACKTVRKYRAVSAYMHSKSQRMFQRQNPAWEAGRKRHSN